MKNKQVILKIQNDPKIQPVDWWDFAVSGILWARIMSS
jgi:hypothetical protein